MAVKAQTPFNMEQGLTSRAPAACLHPRVPQTTQHADLTLRQAASRCQHRRTECRAFRKEPAAWQDAGAASLGAGLAATLVDAALGASPAVAADLVTQVTTSVLCSCMHAIACRQHLMNLKSLVRPLLSREYTHHACEACMRTPCCSWLFQHI